MAEITESEIPHQIECDECGWYGLADSLLEDWYGDDADVICPECSKPLNPTPSIG